MDDDTQEEATLQAAIMKNEPRAPGGTPLEGLYREHWRMVTQTAYRITGSAADAEDVLQTVFLRLLRRDRGVADEEIPAGYLRVAAVNAALDLLRSRSAAKGTDLESSERALVDRGAGPERATESGEIRAIVREALGRLSPQMAQIFTLRYVEGYGNREIAKMLGRPQVFVGVTLHRARRKLRDEISRWTNSRQADGGIS
jgi:RNA polymerase sigma-70 factor (ECF subfamily)